MSQMDDDRHQDPGPPAGPDQPVFEPPATPAGTSPDALAWSGGWPPSPAAGDRGSQPPPAWGPVPSVEAGGRATAAGDGPEPPSPSSSWQAHPAGGGPRGRRRAMASVVAAALVVGAAAGGVAGYLGRSLGAPAATVAAPRAPSTSTTPAVSGSNAADTVNVATLVAKVEPALVDIQATGPSPNYYSPLFGNGLNPFGGQQATSDAGTGMVLTSGGLALTNDHVVAGSSTLTVTFNGQTATHPAHLVGQDPSADVALIQVEGVSNLPTVTLGDSSGAAVGDAVLAIGNALNLTAPTGGFTVGEGIVSGLDRQVSTSTDNLSGMIQTDAAISSGDSGGPLVASGGQVIGMNTAAAASSGSNTAQNIGFAIPANQITALLPRLEKGGTVGGGSTGTQGSAGGGLPTVGRNG
ncbi:MAG: S1C family serine protease [Acidimicrobiales bacterium]